MTTQANQAARLAQLAVRRGHVRAGPRPARGRCRPAVGGRLDGRPRGAARRPAGPARRPLPDGPRQRGRRDRDRLRLARPDLPALHASTPLPGARRVGTRRRGHPADLRQAGVPSCSTSASASSPAPSARGHAAPAARRSDHGHAARARGGRGRGRGVLLLHRLRLSAVSVAIDTRDARTAPAGPARDLARGRLLRRRSTCSATSPPSCCAAAPGGRSCCWSSRWRRCSSPPGRSPAAGRTRAGSVCCFEAAVRVQSPARARGSYRRPRWPTPATAHPAARRGRAQRAARGATRSARRSPGQGRALARGAGAGPCPLDRRGRPARAGRARRVGSEAFARLQLTDEMVHYARHDTLTDLPNRGILLDRVEHALQRARRRGAGSRCCSSTSTASSRSTTGSATPPATRCWSRSPGGWWPASAPATPWPGSAATSSRCCSRTSPSARSSRSATGSSRRWPRAPRSPATRSPSRRHRHRVRRRQRVQRGAAAPRRPRDVRGQGPGQVQSSPYEPAIGRARMRKLEMVDALRLPSRPATCGSSTSPWSSRDRTDHRCRGAGPLAARRRRVPTDVFVRLAEETGLVVALGEHVLETGRPRRSAILRAAAGGRDLDQRQHLRAAAAGADVRQHRAARRPVRCDAPSWCSRSPSAQGSPRTRPRWRRCGSSPSWACGSPSTTSGSASPRSATCSDLPVQIVKTDAALAQNIDSDERSAPCCGRSR